MKKRLLLGFLVVATVVGLLQLDDPLRALTEFIIAGIVPGFDDVSLGFFPSLGIALFILLLIRRWFKAIRLEMLGRTASQIGKEKIKSDFVAKNSGAVKATRPSSGVIAPNPETSN